MARPTGTPPTWSTSAVYTATTPTDPHDGAANKVEPTSGQKANGFEPRYRIPAQFLNWIFSRLSLWLEYIASFIDSSDEFVYPATKSRTRVYSVENLVFENPGNWTRSQGAASPTTDSQFAWFYLPHLPLGAIVTQVDLMVQSSAARATATDRWRGEPFRHARNFAVPSSSGASLAAAANPTPAAVAVQTISWVLGSPETIDATEDLLIEVRGPIGSLGPSDVILGARVHFTDPGPRNF